MTYRFFDPGAKFSNNHIRGFMIREGYLPVGEDEVEKCDFYLFTGGSDISPELYNEKDTDCYIVRPERDLIEAFYMLRAKIEKKPCIGICRGFQLLNIISGVKLIQDVTGHSGTKHAVTLSSRTADYLPSQVKTVNSTHHQAVPYSAAEQLKYDEFLWATAQSKSGATSILEGGLCKEYNFAGVQYHPEYTDCPMPAESYFHGLISRLMN